MTLTLQFTSTNHHWQYISQLTRYQHICDEHAFYGQIQIIPSGGPQNFFFLSATYFTEGRTKFPWEKIGPRGVRTSIYKETYNTCDFPGCPDPPPPTPDGRICMHKWRVPAFKIDQIVIDMCI